MANVTHPKSAEWKRVRGLEANTFRMYRRDFKYRAVGIIGAPCGSSLLGEAVTARHAELAALADQFGLMLDFLVVSNSKKRDAIEQREDLAAVYDLVARGKVDSVIIRSVSDVARNQDALADFLRVMRDTETSVVSAEFGGTIDPKSFDLVMAINSILSDHESARRRKRVTQDAFED